MDKIFIETTQEKYDKKFKDGVKIVDPIEDMEKSYLGLLKALKEDDIKNNHRGE
ncbi:MAG: hypothetical protein IKR19_09075 [Acholeplasmatales bacterium]|nr:hypothetical protein [Acholeplasmatales bacterium]